MMNKDTTNAPRHVMRPMALGLALTWAAIAVALASMQEATAATPHSQPKSCSYQSGPACPPVPPTPGVWAFSTDVFFGKSAPDATFHSLSDVSNWYTSYFGNPSNTAWCASTYVNTVEEANVWGPVPQYQDGIYIKDSFTMMFNDVGYTQPPPPAPQCNAPFQSNADVLMQRTVACPANMNLTYSSSPLTGPSCALPPATPNPPKQLGCCSGTTTKGNPVNVSNGNKYQAEVDYVGVGNNPLKFVRSYNSLQAFITWGDGSPQDGAFMGSAWTATYFQYLTAISVTDSTTTYNAVYAYRPDGRLIIFSQYNGIYSPDGDVPDSLMQTATGWQYQTADDTIETYDTNGQLVAIATRGQAPLTVTRSGVGDPPSSVADAFGHSLQFTYALDVSGDQRLVSITDPTGAQIQYAYDSFGNLSSVTYQDLSTRSYTYAGYSNHALMTLTDEANVAYASWTYDALGDQAMSSQHAGGVEAYSFSYATSGSGGSVTVTDPLGTVRTYSQQLVWGVYRMTGSTGLCPGCGEDQSRIYDANGNITSRTDFNNNQTTYVYDETTNLETSRTEAYGTPQARTITTQWNASWHQPALITEPNRTTAFTYDPLGNVLTKTITDTATSLTRIWTNTYDSYGRVLTAKGPRTDLNSTTTYAYYTCSTGYQCGQLQTITNAVGHITTFNTYNAHGQPLTLTDPNGTVTTLTYDARLRLTSRQVGTETTSFAYYPTGLLRKVTLPDSSTIQYTYDPAHRLTNITDSAGNYITYTLDAMGNRTAENAYDPTNTLHRTHTRVYSSLNLLYQDINAADTAAVTTTYGYDSNGNQTATDAPLARNTTKFYDALNRLSQVTDPASGNTYLGYDANDNLTSVKDPRSLTTTYQYNGFGDVKQVTSPDTGTTANTYDSGGNLATATDARGAVATYAYDALNRVTSVAYKKSGTTDQTITFTYDVGTNGKGHLTGASDANHVLSWTYDALGRVVGKGQTVGTVTKSVGYAYTNADLTTLTTPSGQTVVYGYNSNHQIVSISINGTTLLSSATYEPFGGVNGWTWGNGTKYSRSYNTDGLVSQINAIETTNYSYDNANRISGIANTSNSTLSWTYGYDSLDRLTSALETGTTLGWTYDANGNRLTQTGTSAWTVNVRSTNNQITSTSGAQARTYTYDTSGNVLTYLTNTFTYSDSNRMKTVKVGSSTTTYVINALGQRVKKSGGSAGTVLYMFDEAGHLLGEYTSTGALGEETVWLGYVPVATIQPSGSSIAIYYIQPDHLNVPRKVSRPSDNKLAWRWDNDPFGVVAPTQNPQGLGNFVYNLRFPGQYYDAESGLNYNYFRDYDPQVGRYIESDPVGLQAGVNTYAYVGSDPISYLDPFGLDETHVVNTSGGRSIWDGPTNGNWGGKCWSGGQYSCGGHPMGTKPPTDSADRCYMHHDNCYDKCSAMKDGKAQYACIKACDAALVKELKALPDDPTKWPEPPRKGTESDTKTYLNGAARIF